MSEQDEHKPAMRGKLTDRLRGKYPIGPERDGKPEFGYRQFPAPQIQHEAADEIERLQAELAACRQEMSDWRCGA